MSLLKKLAGQTALYGLSSMLGRALNFLLVPFYTSVLAAAEFGIMTELYTYVAFLNIVYLFGMETAYFRYATKEGFEEKTVYNNAQSLLFINSIIISGSLILFSAKIAALLDYPDKGTYIIWLAIIIATDSIVAIPFARLRLQKKAGQFAATRMANIIINILLNLFFLVFCKKIHEGALMHEYKDVVSQIYDPSFDVGYVFLSNLIANLLFIPMLWKSFSKYRFELHSRLIKPMISYSYPLFIMGLAGMINEVSSRPLLKEILPQNFYTGRTNLEALGIFGACYRLSMFMTLAIQSFRYAAEPFFFSQASDKNSPVLFANIMKWFIVVCLLIFLVVSLNIEIFGLILRNPIYREGLGIVPFLLLGNLFLGVYYNLSIWFKLTDKTHFGTLISIIGAILTVLLNIILIPIYGYMGSAVTTLLCYFIMTVISYWFGQKYYPIPYPIGRILSYIGVSIALVVLSLQVSIGLPIAKMAVDLFLLVIFIAIVFLFEKKNLNFKRI
ncbi:MAG TPA: oligosaccharide flippase family protein [Cytophagaceae bacterium]|jgi:O-antigen/teichoic acid export membrane protein